MRHPECIKNWPGCVDGEYNPACCRFPKSCSCDVVDGVPTYHVEPPVWMKVFEETEMPPVEVDTPLPCTAPRCSSPRMVGRWTCEVHTAVVVEQQPPPRSLFTKDDLREAFHEGHVLASAGYGDDFDKWFASRFTV